MPQQLCLQIGSFVGCFILPFNSCGALIQIDSTGGQVEVNWEPEIIPLCRQYSNVLKMAKITFFFFYMTEYQHD